MREIHSFTNKEGSTLRGILHYPSDISSRENQKDLFVMPNGGIMGGEGDFRAHLRIARRLADEGFYVFRFSPAGTGNSDGCIADCRQKNLFNQIESGLFVSDMVSAVKYIQTIDNFESIILTGICGGAITSFLSAAELKEITHVIPIGVPVYLDSEQNDDSLRLPAQEAEMIVKNYINRLVSWESWMRVLSLKTDFKVIRRAILRILSEKVGHLFNIKTDRYFNANPRFNNAAKRILKANKKIFFIFGGNDGFWLEFKNQYLDKYFQNTNPPFEYYLVPSGNHMLTSVEMQFDATEAILNWMTKNTN